MTEPRSRTDRVATEGSSLLHAHENERRRLSRELHDEVGQGLMSLRLSVGILVKDAGDGPLRKRAQATLDILDNTIDGLRRILGRLSPRPLENLGLLGAIRREADLLAKQKGMIPDVALPKQLTLDNPEVEIAIYRLVQEALHNIAKHSGARNFSVALQGSAKNVRLQISDNGAGIGSKTATSVENFGVAGMRERVKELGGTLRIYSIKNGGTRLQIEIPLESAVVRTMQTLVPNVGTKAS
ncbi:MAG: sensor histidine kinase [Terriglobales bacterium]|nr:sensor histidine kinase [Terriglobales bacterium]